MRMLFEKISLNFLKYRIWTSIEPLKLHVTQHVIKKRILFVRSHLKVVQQIISIADLIDLRIILSSCKIFLSPQGNYTCGEILACCDFSDTMIPCWFLTKATDLVRFSIWFSYENDSWRSRFYTLMISRHEIAKMNWAWLFGYICYYLKLDTLPFVMFHGTIQLYMFEFIWSFWIKNSQFSIFY